MQKDILLQMLEQNQNDCSKFVNNINTENANFRLTKQTATAGFIYRHLGETANLIAQFYGYKTAAEGTTIGQTDTGKPYGLETSRLLFDESYNAFKKIINETSDQDWLEQIETSWFGKISRIKLFSIALYHNSHHCGQISSALLKGKKY